MGGRSPYHFIATRRLSVLTGTLDSMIPTSTDTCDDCELLSSQGGINGTVYAQWETQWGQEGSTLKITDVRANAAATLVTFDLVADPSAIGQAAQTRNQIATAEALEYVFTEGSKDQTKNTPAYGVYEAVNSLSSAGGTPALQAALNEVDPESLAAFTTARESNAQQFSHALWQRVSIQSVQARLVRLQEEPGLQQHAAGFGARLSAPRRPPMRTASRAGRNPSVFLPATTGAAKPPIWNPACTGSSAASTTRSLNLRA